MAFRDRPACRGVGPGRRRSGVNRHVAWPRPRSRPKISQPAFRIAPNCHPTTHSPLAPVRYQELTSLGVDRRNTTSPARTLDRKPAREQRHQCGCEPWARDAEGLRPGVAERSLGHVLGEERVVIAVRTVLDGPSLLNGDGMSVRPEPSARMLTVRYQESFGVGERPRQCEDGRGVDQGVLKVRHQRSSLSGGTSCHAGAGTSRR
jgi:hypothetical protein